MCLRLLNINFRLNVQHEHEGIIRAPDSTSTLIVVFPPIFTRKKQNWAEVNINNHWIIFKVLCVWARSSSPSLRSIFTTANQLKFIRDYDYRLCVWSHLRYNWGAGPVWSIHSDLSDVSVENLRAPSSVPFCFPSFYLFHLDRIMHNK